MKHLFSCTVLLCGALVSVAPRCQAQTWKVPDPASASAPGALAAPASDPRSYPDAVGLEKRAALVVDAVASNDLDGWRRGYFSGGDPGKYLPLAAMARLLKDPADPEVRRLMNDERSPREHYHFAALNWARFLPLFGETLTPQTRAELSARAGRFTDYLRPKGTENHRVMSMSSANVLPHYLDGGRIALKDKDAALTDAREQLRRYVKGLYAAGQGEWDSSTYLMFDVHGMLNIYDFSPDPQARLLAQSALDWFIAGYALKYRDGIYTAPNQRGFYDQPVQSIADQTGWLWWGSQAQVTPEAARGHLYSLRPITSSWRPNAVLTRIARKELPVVPFEARNSKPNYWFGQEKTPQAGAYYETVYNGRGYTLGSLWNGYGGQITRMQLVAQTPTGPVAFSGGNPRKSDHTGKITEQTSYGDGNGRYDQSAQFGPTYVSMSRVPDDESLDYSFFSLPPEAGEPVKIGEWQVVRAGDTFVGLYSLGGQASLSEIPLSEKEQRQNAEARAAGGVLPHQPQKFLKFPGRRTGFVLHTADALSLRPDRDQAGQLTDFGASLQNLRVDATRFAPEMEVALTAPGPQPRALRVRYQPDADRAAAWKNGEPVVFEAQPVYNSRYVFQQNGVLTVNDGSDGYTVDFSGEMPVYKPWSAPAQ